MVELGGAAKKWVVDTAGVELEGVQAGIHGNRDWADGGGDVLEISLRARGNGGEGRDGSTDVGSAELALALDSLVWVAGLGINTVVLDDVLEGLGHQTTVATLKKPKEVRQSRIT